MVAEIASDAIRQRMSDLFELLPSLEVVGSGEIHYPASDPALLVKIGDDAEAAVRVINLGLSGIGVLLAFAAPLLEGEDSVGAGAVGAVGLLIAELGALSDMCVTLAAHCRQETADFDPPRKDSTE